MLTYTPVPVPGICLLYPVIPMVSGIKKEDLCRSDPMTKLQKSFDSKPYFFSLLSNTIHSTWLERVMLIADFKPQPSLLLVISPSKHLYLQEQVKAKNPENRCISVNRSRAIFAFFTVLGVLHLGICQRDFESRDLFSREQATQFLAYRRLYKLEVGYFLLFAKVNITQIAIKTVADIKLISLCVIRLINAKTNAIINAILTTIFLFIRLSSFQILI